jgi:RNA polymerase sigma-70 factor (ECF subfamily)
MIAEELVQESYRRALAAHQHPYPATEEHLRPRLLTIVRNLWYNDVRRRKVVESHSAKESAEPAAADTPDTILCRRLLQSEVRDAVEAPPEALREIIVLREIESLSYAEIVRLQECPIGTVMSRLARARAALRVSLARHGSPVKGVER